MKILALDPGDVWVGTALSDTIGITCKPYQTIRLPELEEFLRTTIAEHAITTIVVGYPKTMRGTHSTQTEKVIALVASLEKTFPTITWKLWDERLSSAWASRLETHKHDAAFKRKQHSLAASFILQSYLDYRAQSGASN